MVNYWHQYDFNWQHKSLSGWIMYINNSSGGSRILSRTTFMHQGYHPSFLWQGGLPLEWKTPSWLLVGQRQQWSRMHHGVCFEEVSVTLTQYQQTEISIKPCTEIVFCIVGQFLDIKKGTAHHKFFIYNIVLDGRKMNHWQKYWCWCLMTVATMHHWHQNIAESLSQCNSN